MYRSFLPRAVSLALSGTAENHRKLRILCLTKMKSVWDVNVSKKFLFSDLAKKRFVDAGGKLDRQGCVPYDHYIALLGKPFFCWLHHFSFQIYLHSPIPTPCADMTGSSWAYEPEVTAMAYLLETTIACFSSNPGIDELSLYDHWAFYSPKPGLKTNSHSPPYLLLKNINQSHFEPLIICAQP